jgi:hypothetical protein
MEIDGTLCIHTKGDIANFASRSTQTRHICKLKGRVVTEQDLRGILKRQDTSPGVDEFL